MPTAFADVPRGPFGKRATAEQVTEGLDLTGKTALVTGCASGIGLEAMRVLALRGAHVLALARTQTRAAAAVAAVRSPQMKGTMTPLACEQADFASVAACADVVQALKLPLDMLICNAGIAGMGSLIKLEPVNGIDRQFAVNHLSHFILVNRLLDLVKAAPQGRIVVVASRAHRGAPAQGIEFDNLSGARPFKGLKAYGQSKLANILMTRELARRLQGTSVTANALHPGVVHTNIFSPGAAGALKVLMSVVGPLFMKSPQAGAATTCYVATNPALAKVSGAYFNDCNPEVPSPLAENDALAAKLWTVSEDLTRAYLR